MQQEVRHHRISLTALSSDLISVIAKKLQSDKSVVNLRAACRLCGSSIPPPALQLHPFLPALVPSQNFDIYSDAPLLLVSTAIFIFQRSPADTPLLAAVEQIRSGKFRLFHPFTGKPIQNPSSDSKNCYYFSTKLDQGCNLRLSDGITAALPFHKSSRGGTYCVNKVILWQLPPFNSVVVLYDTGYLDFFGLSCNDDEQKIKEGVRDNVVVESELRGVKMGVGSLVDDIVVWKDMVWAVGRKGKLYGINYHYKKVDIVANVNFDVLSIRRKRLLVDSSSDRLCMVLVPELECSEFYVYKLNHCFAWEKVDTLGDHILFANFDSCFFVRSELLSRFKGNCIVFSMDSFRSYSNANGYWMDHALFKEATHPSLHVGVCKYGEGKNFELISLFPDCSAMFCPPLQCSSNVHEEQQALVEGQEQTAADACTSDDPKNTNAVLEEQIQAVNHDCNRLADALAKSRRKNCSTCNTLALGV